MTPLDQYLDNPPPGYAILVSGSWGAGKSFRWKLYSDSVGKRGLQAITFSVAGLQTYAELEAALFKASVSDFGPAALREAGAIVGRAFLRYLNVNPDEIKLKADFKSGKTVVCLDDVERFGGEFITLFGFIVNIIDEASLHCVLLADEKKASSRFKDYAEFKERIVGKTIPLLPDLNEFCKVVVNGFEDDGVREMLERNLDLIVSQLSDRKIANLRTARYFISELAIVFLNASPSIGSDLRALVSAVAFWAIGMSKSSDNLDAISNVFSADINGISYMISVASGGEGAASVSEDERRLLNKRSANLIKELGFSKDIYIWPNSVEFSNLILGLDVKFSEIAVDFKLIEDSSVKPEYVYIRDSLNSYRNLNDADLQAVIGEARELLRSGKNAELPVLFDIFRSLYWLSEAGIFSVSKEDWCEEMISNVAGYGEDSSSFDGVIIEVIGNTLAGGERGVFEAFRELGQRIEMKKLAEARRDMIGEMLDGDGTPPDLVRRDRLFADASADEFLPKLLASGMSGVSRLHGAVRGALRVSNAGDFISEEAMFYRELAAIVVRDVAVTSPMTILAAELHSLARSLNRLADHVSPS